MTAFPDQREMAFAWQELSRRVLHAEKVNRTTADLYYSRAETAADVVDAQRMTNRASAYGEVVRWVAQIEATWPVLGSTS